MQELENLSPEEKSTPGKKAEEAVKRKEKEAKSTDDGGAQPPDQNPAGWGKNCPKLNLKKPSARSIPNWASALKYHTYQNPQDEGSNNFSAGEVRESGIKEPTSSRIACRTTRHNKGNEAKTTNRSLNRRFSAFRISVQLFWSNGLIALN